MSTEFLTLVTLEFSSKLEVFCRSTLNAAGVGFVLLIRKKSLRMRLWDSEKGTMDWYWKKKAVFIRKWSNERVYTI